MLHLIEPIRARALVCADPVLGSVALPFAEVRQFEIEAGRTIAEIVEGLIAERVIDAAWRPWLQVFVDDLEFAPETWRVVKPRAGRLISIRARPGWDFVVAAAVFLFEYVILPAVIGMAVQSFIGAPVASQQSFEQLKDIDASRNEVAPFRKLNAVFGEFRVFPMHAAKPYTIANGEDVVLYMLFSWGLGPVALDVASLKLGDTPLTEFDGVMVQHRLKPGDAWPGLFPSSVDEDEGPGLIEYADGWVQRTTTSTDAQELHVECAFPEGVIFYSGDGDLKPYSVQIRVRYRLEGSSTWLSFDTGASAAEGHVYTVSGTKPKPFRHTFIRAGVAKGRYEVAVKRNEIDQPGPKGFNSFQWSKLRALTYDKPVSDDNFALTAVAISAGDQLKGVVDLFNGVVTRIAPKWDSGAEEFGAEGETSNPAEVLRWIACGPGAAKPRTIDEVDDPTLGAWAELCTLRGWRVDMELRAGGGQDEVMDMVARCGRASLVERNGRLSVVVDDVQPAPSQLFTPRNSWGFRASHRFPADTHALRCQFNNSAKGYVRDEMIVYYPGYDLETAELIVTVPMAGKVTEQEVFESASRYIAEELLRPEDYVWRCDIENLLCKRGHRVAISHYVIAVGRTSGARVAELVLNEAETHVIGVLLDEQVDQTPGDTYGVQWRRADDEVVVQSIALTNLGNGLGNELQFASSLPIASAPRVGDLLAFGDATIETIDCTVQNVGRATDFEGEITAVPYTAELWSGDGAEVPPWSSNVSGEAFPRPPAPAISGYRADANGIYVSYDFPADTAHRVEEVELWMRSSLDATAAFAKIGSVPSSSRIAQFPPGNAGEGYALKLVSVGTASQRTMRRASDVIEVISGGVGDVVVGVLTNESHTVATAADGSGGSYAAAGGFFKLFRGDRDVSDGTDPDDIDTSYEVVSFTSGLSISIDAETGEYAIASLSVDQAQAVLRGTNRGFSVERIYSISKAKGGTAGTNGADASTIQLSATSQQFLFDPENNANPSSQSITLSVARQNAASGSVVFTSSPSVTLTGSGDSRALSVANFGANTAVEITATLGSLVDKITIVRTRAGGNLFTTVRSSNVSLTGRTLKKESGSAAWDSQAYSIESFVGGCFASARPVATDKLIMFGLNADPATDAHYTSLDFAFYIRGDGNLEIYEDGAKVWPSSGTVAYAAGDVLSVAYDGQTVRYFQNGTLRRVRVTDPLLRLYFDSSFYTAAGSITDVAFGPAGGTAGKQVTRYTSSIAPPSTPTGVVPAGWSLSIPSGPDAKWASTATISADDTLLLSAWSTPALITKPNARGAYVAGTTYYQFDSVTFNGGTYELLVASSTGNAPSGTAEANAYWSVIAAPGSPGEPGTPPSSFSATIDLSSSSIGVNLRTIADAAGYTGASDANITFEVESGVTITGLAGNATNGGIAIDSGTWPTGSYSITLALVVKSGGKVYGGGGSAYGFAGGDAVYCRVPMSVTNNAGGELKGGGGGGGIGEGWLNSGTDSEGEYFETQYPGGVGGGGFPNGVGASNGTTSGGGAGAAGESLPGGRATGAGGAGGGAGANGSNGSAATGTTSARWIKWFGIGAGGVAGYAVRKNGNTVPVTGTVVGTAA